MNAINWLLINVGNAVLWLGGILGTFFGALWSVIYAVTNPVLSPVLRFLNPLTTAIGDGIYAVLAAVPVWLGLTVLSAIIGVLMLIVFRYTSNQAAIGRARDQITGNLLALKLFKDDFRVALVSQGRLLAALGRLQWHMLFPIFIMIFPLLLAVAQMGLRYQWRPLEPGETANVTLQLHPDHADVVSATLAESPVVAEAVGPVPGGGELVWRITAGEVGRHTLTFTVADADVEKELVVGEPFARVSAERPGRRWTSQILHPAEPPLPSDCPVQKVVIDYPGVESYLYGANWWILYFFVVSMLFAIAFVPVFKVRF
jgi:hypothetical protein